METEQNASTHRHTANQRRTADLQTAIENAVEAGIPMDDLDEDVVTESLQILSESGQVTAALDRIAVPLPGGSFHRGILTPAFFSLSAICFLTVALLTFNVSLVQPSFKNFYGQTNTPLSSSLQWSEWVNSTFVPFLSLALFLLLIILAANTVLDPWSVPRWLIGRRRYLQHRSNLQRARARQTAPNGHLWRAVHQTHQFGMVRIANRWRKHVPFVMTIVIGTIFVVIYALLTFLPLVQLIVDLSGTQVMDWRTR